MTVLFGVLGLIAIAAAVLWLISLPGEENEEEIAGFVAGNWERIKRDEH